MNWTLAWKSCFHRRRPVQKCKFQYPEVKLRALTEVWDASERNARRRVQLNDINNARLGSAATSLDRCWQLYQGWAVVSVGCHRLSILELCMDYLTGILIAGWITVYLCSYTMACWWRFSTLAGETCWFVYFLLNRMKWCHSTCFVPLCFSMKLLKMTISTTYRFENCRYNLLQYMRPTYICMLQYVPFLIFMHLCPYHMYPVKSPHSLLKCLSTSSSNSCNLSLVPTSLNHHLLQFTNLIVIWPHVGFHPYSFAFPHPPLRCTRWEYYIFNL